MKENAKTTQVTHPSPRTHQKQTILVVEDDRSHRTLMDKILKSCDFDTEQAENGFIALFKIDTGQHFDAIIMDWDMPELDGLETAKAIRMREVKDNSPRIPIIAFTSNRRAGDKELCLAAGMDAYLPKDVFLPKWRQTLTDNLQGLIAGSFHTSDFENAPEPQETYTVANIDITHFDVDLFEQTANLLKADLAIAIEEYLEDAASYIQGIEAGFNDKNIKQVERSSHPLKSNSKGFGLMGLCLVSEAINTICNEKDDEQSNIEKLAPLIPQLKQAFSTGEKHLKQEMKRHIEVL